MLYRTIHGRCAVNFHDWSTNLPHDKLELLLKECSFEVLPVNLFEVARSCIGVSAYKLRAHVAEAPHTVDCSSFTKWVYGCAGVWLPRLAIQQSCHGYAVLHNNLQPGDLLFTSGCNGYYLSDPQCTIGHVGILTDVKTVIHAANKHVGVIESPIEVFLNERAFRLARRYLPRGEALRTLRIPEGLEIETSDDIFWHLMSTLP